MELVCLRRNPVVNELGISTYPSSSNDHQWIVAGSKFRPKWKAKGAYFVEMAYDKLKLFGKVMVD